MKKFNAKFKNTKALIAEDIEINQIIIKEMLESMECSADIAEDGVEALKMFLNGDYNIIFMDVQMPNMDGFEATKEIRKHENRKGRIPIIAITANALQGDEQACLDSGMDDYISKPIKGVILEEMLIKHIENK